MATYNLTTNGDNLIGTSNNDTFNGTYDAAVTDTFGINDFLNGGIGIDTLHINHLLDVAITPPDNLWTNLRNIENVVINTTGNGAQTITTGVNFQTAFAPLGIEFTTKTTGAGAINLTMTTFTGVAKLETTSTAGAQNIVTGSDDTTVTAISDAGALNIKGVGLKNVFATTKGAGAQTIGDGSGNGANLVLVRATSAGGAQTITSTSANRVVVKAISVAGKQIIKTGAGADIITASTTSAINTINTGVGNDRVTILATTSGSYTISGGTGNDTLRGGKGNDTLTGWIGNDILNGGAGVDNMIGGDGSDLYYVDIATDIVTETNALVSSGGIDRVLSSITYTLPSQVENLTLTGKGNINGNGNSLANRITGNIGNNSLSGGDGNDTLTGGIGNDILTGGSGNDFLTGGSGNDFFSFNSTSESIDRISDFSIIDDTFLVSRSGFGGGLVIGELASNQFTIGSSATTSDHRFFYNSNNGGFFFDVDGNGATSAVGIATLSTGLTTMTNQDISVF
ncbi:calcium-binding protein [Geminocystis sp.]|uniref:calcium-binding protein n=1 Tax=Geminocystis sp. TaxID=2664100 RepID=UPI003592E993